MTLEEYFNRPDTPMVGSPVGKLMAKIVGKQPGISLEDARTEAHALLRKAAGSWKYHIPRVLSLEEETEQQAKKSRRFEALTQARAVKMAAD